MRLTVLGKSPSWQDAGGACSGYLVEAGGTTMLIDCGNGVLGKLRERIDYVDLDAVVISHFHADHVLDLAPLAYALTLSPRRGGLDLGSRLALHLPPRGSERLHRLVSCWGSDELVDQAYAVDTYDESAAIELGPLTVTATEVPHFTETFAITVTEGDRSFTFSADCGPSDALVEAASGSELLLCEATIAAPEPDGPRGHLTPAEAGTHAAAAGVGRLVMTHLSDEVDQDAWIAAARAEYGGPVEIATEGASYEI